MLSPTTGCLSPVRVTKDAAVAIILVYDLNSQRPSRWDSISNLQSCSERLSAQHTEANIMAYGYEDLDMRASPITTIDKAARNLLSELDGSKSAKNTSSCNDLRETQYLGVLDPAMSVLFICWGFAGLVVKKALVLAKSHNGSHSISQRVAGIAFLGTPHSDDVQVWTDRIQSRIIHRARVSQKWSTTQTLESAENFAELTRDFQQLSSLYMVVYFCDTEWLECSRATVLHSDCLWSMVSQNYPRGSTKANHYILPESTSALLFMAYLERATVGMRKLASRKSYHKCLESERATKNSYAGERLQSTCNWFFEHDEYCDWSTADGPAYLWISGASGTGKSTLCSAIVDRLLAGRQQRDVIAYCFLEEWSEGDDYAKRILEVLFRELQENDVVSNFLLYSLLPEIENVDSPMSREAFQRFLRSLLGNIDCQTRIVLVLDGVDKDQWIKGVVIDEITRINSLRHRSDLMRCLISSRESCDYNVHTFPSGNISLDNELGVQRDVLQFAECRLGHIHPTIATSYLTSVAKKICLQGQGNFLWVAVVVESLQCAFPVAELEKEVQSLPPTIDDLYRRILKYIPSQEAEIMRRAFAWLIAASRPLEPCELLEALAIEPDGNRPPGIGTLSSQIWKRSELIITTRENTVRLRHPSVKRYLLSAERTDTWGTSMAEAHALLAQTCLTLVTPEGDRDSPFRLRSRKVCESKIKFYASTNWAFHYGVAESHSKNLVGALHRSLTISLHHDCEEFSLPEMARFYQIETTILGIAAYYGFASLTRVSLEMGVNPNGSCDSCVPPLALAAAGGHSKVVALLLQQGASTAARGETALHLAAAYGSRMSARLLLAKECKADSDAGYGTPLHAAAFSGNLDIIKMLMNFNVDLNARVPISGETPLHLAASRGHVRIVKWLVGGLGTSDEEVSFYDWMVRQRYYQTWTDDLLTDSVSTPRFSCRTEDRCAVRESMSELQSLCGRYADINTRTREGRTALHLAASNGHTTTVRCLLDTGAEINLIDHKLCTALGLAAENGHLNAVKLLLTAGADLDFQQLGRTLKNVTNNGHDKIANLLAWHFFSTEIMGKPCQWPVLALATQSKQNTVRNAIRKNHPHGQSTARRLRGKAPCPDRKM